jgi:hypothetical protein
VRAKGERTWSHEIYILTSFYGNSGTTSKCGSTSSYIIHIYIGCSSSKPSINVNTILSVGTLKHLDSIVMGN